jgi:hypothetical protein
LKKINESARARGTVLRFAILGAAVLAALIGAAGRSGAASPVITTSQSSIPGNNVPVAFSGVIAGQNNYVSYTVGFARGADNNNLSHARVSEPVSCSATTGNCSDAVFPGATVVSVVGSVTVGSTTTMFCSTAYAVGRGALGAEGVTCPIGALAPNATIALTIVFKVPTKAAVCAPSSFDNRAALLVDESTSDSQPQSSHLDTFATGAGLMTTPLSCDAANALNSFALPNTAGSFQTDTTPGPGNFQASAVKWGNVDPAGFPGGGLQLFECGIPGGAQGTACDPSVANPCGGVPCVTQTSVIIVPGNLGAYFVANPMTITLTFFPSDFPKGFNWRKLVIYHDGHQVVACPATTFDPDCLSLLTQDKATGNVIATIVGPANGGWGGI